MCGVLPKGVLCLCRNSCLCSRSYFGGVGSAGRPTAFFAFAGAASRLRAEALRRASTQAGRPFVRLTYSTIRSASPQRLRPPGRGRPCCGLSFERPQTRTGRSFFKHSHLVILSSSMQLMTDSAKDLHLVQSGNGSARFLSFASETTTRLRNSYSIVV
jgi:hypothetical protein